MGTRSRGISMPGAGHGEHPWKATYGAWPLAHPFRDTETNLCSNTPRDPEGVGGYRCLFCMFIFFFPSAFS